MKRFYNRLVPALVLALSLSLMAAKAPAQEAAPQAAASATEQVPGQTARDEAGIKALVEMGEEDGTVQSKADAQREEAAVGHAETGGHEAGSLSKEKLNDLFWRVVNFVILVLILVKFAAKPLGNGLAARRQKVREEIEGLEARRQDAEKAYQELVAKLAGIEKDIKEIVDRAAEQAEKERARIIEAAEKNAADLTRQAEMAVQKELLDAKRLLRDEMADRAAAMAEEIIKSSLTADDQVRIVDQYLSKVEAVQ
ncbi:MAG TPA: ATP synthase F0 subunit B [Desulfobulbaceae bacterium]|nr:ATP synthase F0 subunit B [Desulfobulbaceae bacterium]